MGTGWDRAGRARNEFADVIDGLTPDQLDASTPCGHWTPRHILGHLTSFVDLNFGQFFMNMLRHRFDYDRAADTAAKRLAERPVPELVATLRANADKTAWLPMFPEDLTLTDTLVHTQDVRRGIGDDAVPADELLRDGLTFMVENRMASNLGGPKLDGLAVTATDLGWSHGSGAAVEGPAEALLMAMAGRDVLDELSGAGVERLRG